MSEGSPTPQSAPPAASVNFEFLRTGWPDLAALGAFAETYADPDPVAAILKLRQFCEQVADDLQSRLNVVVGATRPDLIDILRAVGDEGVVPRVILDKLHLLRMKGNRAAHDNAGETSDALFLLREAHAIGRFLHSMAEGEDERVADFENPPPGGLAAVGARREKRAILSRVAEQERQLAGLLKDVERERERAKAAEADRESLIAKAKEQSGAAITTLQKTEADRPAENRDFDEATARTRLIDLQLREAGWLPADEVDPGRPHYVTEQRVAGQATKSGVGHADYTLLDGDRVPLAVIEAKRPEIDPRVAQTQATQYADALEEERGRRPVVFLANGYSTLIIEREGAVPRKVAGFYSESSLRSFFTTERATPFREIEPDTRLLDRGYQQEAVKSVLETFDTGRRAALIVQATGTGKTRVAVGLVKALTRAGRARRVLFLCDRRELRKQAKNAFSALLPNESPYLVGGGGVDPTKRLYFATYPGMIKVYEQLDVGFFDLIVADESHRSLYNRFSLLFSYFDAFRVGLTATPVNYIDRDTFRMFECREKDATANYSLDEAIDEGHLVPFNMHDVTTDLLRKGIKWDELDEDERERLLNAGEDPEEYYFEPAEIDKHVFNRDTQRFVLRNLMDEGIKVDGGSRIGKSIVFARSHDHAVKLATLFGEEFPQYGGDFCRVIDSHDPRAESLLDDFKNPAKEPTVAVSVDMLDTGVDVPEVVNLVFAKPVFTPSKFWQMVGRGTRLCPDLLGPGEDKTHFEIFDHWGNAERFGTEGYPVPDATPKVSPKQKAFEARLDLARAALDRQDAETFDLAAGLLVGDLKDLPARSLPVREKARLLRTHGTDEAVRRFEDGTEAVLRTELAPLMGWVDLAGAVDATRFDALVAELQTALLAGGNRFENLRDDLLDWVGSLRINLSQVRAKKNVIDRVQSAAFWESVTPAALERVRGELRGVARHRDFATAARPVKETDIPDGGVVRRKVLMPVGSAELVAYRKRVRDALETLADADPTLRKIKAGEQVTGDELDALVGLVLERERGLDLRSLREVYPEADDLAAAIRQVAGLAPAYVEEEFDKFRRDHPGLSGDALRFLSVLGKYVARHGPVTVERLYEEPFAGLASDGPDALFEDAMDDLAATLDAFRVNV